MRRPVAISCAVAMVGMLLSACGTNAYCLSVQDQITLLNTFAKEHSNASFTKYAQAMDALAASAPADVKGDIKKLATLTRGVLAAHKEVGVSLEELEADPNLVRNLSSDQVATLNSAYDAFSNTRDQRTALVASAKRECDITIK